MFSDEMDVYDRLHALDRGWTTFRRRSLMAENATERQRYNGAARLKATTGHK